MAYSFPLETQLSHEFVSQNNLYRNAELNKDQSQKGYFEENKDVIIDQTNCRLKYINGFINAIAINPDIEIKFKIIHQPLSLLLERNIARARATGLPKIPEEIITNMYNNLLKMIETSEFKKLIDKHECLV